jgi:hypothetical protein
MKGSRYKMQTAGTLKLWRRTGLARSGVRARATIAPIWKCASLPVHSRRKIQLSWGVSEWQPRLVVLPAKGSAQQSEPVSVRRVSTVADRSGSLRLICAYGAEILGPDWHLALNGRGNLQIKFNL